MKFLVVGLVKNDQLERIKQEAGKLGHTADGCYVSSLIIKASNSGFKSFLRDQVRSLEDYDLIYLWSVGKKRWEWYTTCYVLHKSRGTVIVNSKVVDDTYKLYLSPVMNYYKQYKNDLLFPKSAIIYNDRSVANILDDFTFPVIVKTSQGRQGRGVHKVDSQEELVALVRQMQESKEPIILREYIPNDGDIRVFTVGFKAIGAMKRTPPESDFRSNISVGGKGEKFDLEKNQAIKELAEKASEITRTEIAGVDVMINNETGKPYILEVNPGPQFTGLEKYTGVNAAYEIIKYFESLFQK